MVNGTDKDLFEVCNMYSFFKAKINYDTDYNVIQIKQKSILDLFKIDLENHRKARLALYYHLHMQPSEIDRMWYMDFEYLLMDLSQLLKEKNEAEEKAYKESKEKTPDYSKQMKGASNFKTPSFKSPKFK